MISCYTKLLLPNKAILFLRQFRHEQNANGQSLLQQPFVHVHGPQLQLHSGPVVPGLHVQSDPML